MLLSAIAAVVVAKNFLLPTAKIHAGDLPAVTQSGQILIADGLPFRLRGVNLGGWFVEELWMTPWIDTAPGSDKKSIPDAATLWKTVASHLGQASMNRVRTAWRENWITAQDFSRIKSMGMNSVRIPFRSEMLDDPDGLTWLHRAVDMATAAGLYTVLDMHGVRGGQSTDQPTGEVGRNRLWFDVENIAKAEADWTLLSKEFGNNSNVAMFDLMNEPMGAPNPAMLHLVYNRLVQAVRKVAPNKVVLIDDGYKGFETTPHPNLAGWTNVCFSLHFYDFNAKSGDEHVNSVKGRVPKVKELLGYRQAPLFVGEWNVEPFGGPAVIRGVIDVLDNAGFSWAFWTWKVMPTKGTLGDWGVNHPNGSTPVTLDPFQDSEATLIAKMSKIQTTNLVTTPGMSTSFSQK